MKQRIFLCMSMFVCLGMGALAFDFSSWQTLESSNVESINAVLNPGFDEGDQGKQWVLGSEAEISAAHGRNQRGLGIRRTDAGKYSVTTQKLKLKPGTKYIAGVWIRNEGFDPELNKGGSFGLEWYKDKQHLSAAYSTSNGNHDWKLYTREFITGSDPDLDYVFVFFVNKGRLGSASYDDVFVREVGAQWLPAVLSPHALTMDCMDAKVEISSAILGDFQYNRIHSPKLQCFATLHGEDFAFSAQQSGDVLDNRAEIVFGKLPAGNYSLDLQLADAANQVILAKRTEIRMQAAESEVLGQRKVFIDDHGRMNVSGKPFLPVGLYVGGVSEEDVATWKHSPFNFVMPYGGAALKWPGAYTKDHDTENLRYALDKLEAAGIKFGCNLITSYESANHALKSWWDGKDIGINERVDQIADVIKDHPATLFYYICDELPASQYRQIEARRAQLNRRDPDHPTFSAYFQYPELAYYSSCQDITGLIFYPIVNAKSTSMELIVSNMEAAREVLRKKNSAMSLWAVGQAFNWGSYVTDRKRYETEYRYPSAEEYISMVVLPAIYGVKGYIFYSYHTLRNVQGSLNVEEKKQEFEREWTKVCAMGQVLRDLEPWLLSLRAAPEVKVKTLKGKVVARAFMNEEGNATRVLIAGIGPGECEAELSFPANAALQSKYGKTKGSGKGTYYFRGNNICCDILN